MPAEISTTKDSQPFTHLMRYNKLRNEFISPTASFRGKPFWAWNSKLNKHELLFQIDIMHQMGMGGFFIHSRTGLETPYLSPEWFDMIKACCRKAQSLGMQAWLYDEDRWPSGFAGGIVTSDKRFRQKRLRLHCFDAAAYIWNKDAIAVFSAKLNGAAASNVKRISGNTDVPSNGTILEFTVATSPESESFNGQTYVDTLSSEAIKRFIDVTHEAYRKNIGEYFGNVVQGIFTDEPNHGPTCVYSDDGVIESPWTDAMPEVFKKRYGYDIVDNLPAVFFDIDGMEISKPRADYHDCRTFLFVNSFAAQIGRWCRQNNMLFTGHVLNESPLIEQTSFVGSAMRFYEYMDIPGIDILTDCHLPTGGRPEYDTIKQCTSIQRQMGRKQVLSELYGCTGWDFSLEGHKAAGDWQAALGVNFRCLHHCWYSMQGQAKRDYPASISYQTPWWEQYSAIEDYFSRINVLMTRGSNISKVLVIHPNESIWQMIKPGWCKKASPDSLMHEWRRSESLRLLEEKYLYLRDSLITSNIDFDYGDEDIISRYGRINDLNSDFEIGCCSYKTVIIPPLKTIRSSTLELLEKFIACGGKVVVIERMPDYVDAIESADAINLQAGCMVASLNKREILKCLDDIKILEVFDEAGNTAEDILCRCTEDEIARYVFICNTNKDKSYDNISLKIYDTGKFVCAQRWNPFDGSNCVCDAFWGDNFAVIDSSLSQSGSDLLVFYRDELDEAPAECDLRVADIKELEGPFKYSLSEHNVLVLDKCEFVVDSQRYPLLDILEGDNMIRAAVGLKSRNGKMLQPWIMKCDNVNVRVELFFQFDVECFDGKEIFLALEKPESVFRLELNGRRIDTSSPKQWWIDKSLRLISLPVEAIILGNNKLYVDIDYNRCMGFEAMYLLGAFGVRVEGADITMTSLKDEIAVGDWTKQGLPFYSGSVKYKHSCNIKGGIHEKVYIQLPGFDGSCAVVNINGKTAGMIWCKPYEVDITDFVGSANNDIEIEVISHRRNTLGPLHLKDGGQRPGWTGPAEFQPAVPYRQNEYSLVPCGLTQNPRILYKQLIDNVK